MVKFIYSLCIYLLVTATLHTYAQTPNITIDNLNYDVIKSTSKGMFAGQFDQRLNLNPYNGLRHSKNVGLSWSTKGLQNRGITDITEYDGILYATSFYTQNGENGLFISLDYGENWIHKGPNISLNTVAVDDKSIYIGSFSHGLWVSQDAGQTFTQKIGTGFFGPKITALSSNGSITLAGSVGNTYISEDYGSSWKALQDLAGKQINRVAFSSSAIFVATSDLNGIYTSKDNAKSWTKLDSFGNTAVGTLTYFDETLYASKYDASSGQHLVYTSTDEGNTWHITNMKANGATNNISGIAISFGLPSTMFANVPNLGIFKMDLPLENLPTNKFLSPPWDTLEQSALIDKISTYFDHEYPLLGYNYIKETSESTTTTLNFLGLKGAIPEMYYPSHSGIDFALPYGTPVKAAASGIAKYYYCKNCGNTIKIDHLNGYESIYMHLQDTGIVTRSVTASVSEGQVIGAVGMTGNTSGPHLHFEVLLDQQADSSFDNDRPQGRVDPFGWLNLKTQDPWPEFSWTDTLGNHKGSHSKYLWKQELPILTKVLTDINAINSKIARDNKVFDFKNLANLTPIVFNYIPYGIPQVVQAQKNLKYIQNTSFILNMFTTAKQQISTLPNTLEIDININPQFLANVLTNSIKLYYFASNSGTWLPLRSTFDSATNTLSAITDHLSNFAAFGEAIDNTGPTTSIQLAGRQNSLGWYTEPPEIVLQTAEDILNTIYFSKNEDFDWQTYEKPFKVESDGPVTLRYRSVDQLGNYENTNVQVIKINLNNRYVKRLTIKNATVQTKATNQ